MVEIIRNKEAIYDTDNYDVVLVGISTHNRLMGNFQQKMSVKYPVIEKAINTTPCGDVRKLGKRLTVDETKPVICLMFICTYPSRKADFIDYDALEKCMKAANAEFKGKRVMTTVLGSTRFDGRGDKERCLSIIRECAKDIELYVYDYEQITIVDEIKKQKAYFAGLRKQYKGDKEKIGKISEMEVKMREKTFLPTDTYLNGKTVQEKRKFFNI